MNLLTILGLCSLLFVVAFTYWAYYANPTPGQTPRQSIKEAWTNIAVGFGINYLANFMLLPLVGAHMTLGENFMLGWIFTTTSIVRQFVIRRWFNKKL